MTSQAKGPPSDAALIEAIRGLAVDSGFVSSPVNPGGSALTKREA